MNLISQFWMLDICVCVWLCFVVCLRSSVVSVTEETLISGRLGVIMIFITKNKTTAGLKF